VMIDPQTGDAIDPDNQCAAHGGTLQDDVCGKDGYEIDADTG